MLTERERRILMLFKKGLNDYRIAKELKDVAPSSVKKSRENGIRKLQEATEDLNWAKQVGIK
jgi:DNA-binding NarL/FixJ family response regulator